MFERLCALDGCERRFKTNRMNHKYCTYIHQRKGMEQTRNGFKRWKTTVRRHGLENRSRVVDWVVAHAVKMLIIDPRWVKES